MENPALQLVLLALLMAAVPLVVIDIREHRLPNQITYPLIATALLGTFVESAQASDWERLAIATSLNFGVTAAGVMLFLLRGFGLGDVKLLIAMNQILGYFSPWFVFMSFAVALLSASGFSLFRLLQGKLKWKDRIAFGPFLILGYAVFALPLLVAPTLY